MSFLYLSLFGKKKILKICGFKDTCILHKFHVILMVGFKELFHPYAQSKRFYLSLKVKHIMATLCASKYSMMLTIAVKDLVEQVKKFHHIV